MVSKRSLPINSTRRGFSPSVTFLPRTSRCGVRMGAGPLGCRGSEGLRVREGRPCGLQDSVLRSPGRGSAAIPVGDATIPVERGTLVQVSEATYRDMDSTLGDFCRNGFAKLPGLVTDDRLLTAQRYAVELLEGEGLPFTDYRSWAEVGEWRSELFVGSFQDFRVDFLGLCSDLDAVIEHALADPSVELALQRILGAGHHLWYATIRRARVGERFGLRLHHDIAGETGLIIMLSDAPDEDGGMVWLAGSHRWPRVLDSFPFIYPKFIRRLLVGATGQAGDAYLFSNSTWHGRLPSRSREGVAIVLTFLPAVQPRNKRRVPKEIVNRLGPRLNALLRGPDVLSVGDEETSDQDPLFEDLTRGRAPLSPLSPWHAARLAAMLFAPVARIGRWARRTAGML